MGYDGTADMCKSRTRLATVAVLSAAATLLSACSNPEESAAAALADAESDWTSALAELDPAKRLRAYEAAIGDVEGVAKKYAETPQGQAISAGRAVGGVSIVAMRAMRDGLAERAECYAKPTAECLRPFGSRANREGASSASTPDAALATARALVCEAGFAPASAPLEPFKINRPVYAQQLLRVALAAAECGKADEVKSAIEAYKAAEPATGAARTNTYLSILATDALEPAWPSILADLESTLGTGGLNGDAAANVVLSMAIRYAALGDAEAALAKYRYFTDTLNYRADAQSKLSLASRLILAGDPAAGLAVAQDGVGENQRTSYAASAFHGAAVELGRGLGLLEATSAPRPRLGDASSVAGYFAPADAAARTKYASAVAALEAALDAFVGAAPPQDIPIGDSGTDVTYGIVALLHQKLGAEDRAAAAIAKAERVRASRPQGAQTATQESLLPYQALIASAQGKHAEAVAHAESIMRFRSDYVRLVPAAIAAAGDLEQALVAADRVGARSNASGSAQTAIIGALIEAGKLDQAAQVVDAIAGDARSKSVFYWQLVTKAANDGDRRRAEDLAARFGLLNGPGDRLQLVALLLNSEKVARDRGRAEPIIREMFTLGEEIERAGGGANPFQRSEQYLAQEAARAAFVNGHTDLGIELYRAASRKDQRPLIAAFRDGMSARDTTSILMLAHDNLQGEPLGYVIDAAARRLETN